MQRTKQSRRSGIGKRYHTNGALKEKVTIRNGQREGVGRIFYENERLRAEACFRNGKPEGIAKEYYKNGTLAAEAFFRNGKREWITRYNVKGELMFRTTYTAEKAGKENPPPRVVKGGKSKPQQRYR
ncbi:MAG: toxin-antitoxin system YwqK family antitoxin [Thermodesulfobacteriota bacterium]